ncbi:head GIN domain-containing protein [Rubrivivax sp. RP6-9]|uniref:head GIN domain-containing protein n=1 Tax=Rubrivivax sp. RP6-9 TaxID=3415750 RepID=UPI003CC63AB8
MSSRLRARVLLPLLLGVLVGSAGAQGRSVVLEPFDGIEIGGAADLHLAQGPQQVRIDGDDADGRDLPLVVRGGVLRVNTPGSWKFWSSRRLQLHVTLPQLSRLGISGAADVHAAGPMQLERLRISISGAGLARFDQLQAGQLVFSVSGAGDGRIAGEVGDLQLSISGKSDFQGEQLLAHKARVAVSGIGDVTVWVRDDLTLSIAGIGRVDYWGTPRLRRSSSGMATVNALGPKAPAAPPAPPAPPR